MVKVAKLVRLDLDQRKTEWLFTAWLGGACIATMRAVPEGEHVVIHLDVQAWSRELYREYVCSFTAIREVLRESGNRLLFACSDRCDEKMKHFWHMMGFRVFGEIEREGRTIPYAVMEV